MVITYPYLSFSIFLLCEYCCYGAIGSFFCLLVFFRMHIVCVGVVKFSLPSFPRFFFRMHMVAVGGERLPRRMDWIVGRATEGSSGRHSSTLRATPAVIPGKVGEGIANPFPKGALLAPRASGKPFGVSADTRPCSQHLQVRNLVPSGTR